MMAIEDWRDSVRGMEFIAEILAADDPAVLVLSGDLNIGTVPQLGACIELLVRIARSIYSSTWSISRFAIPPEYRR
jgi:hypothetical protein